MASSIWFNKFLKFRSKSFYYKYRKEKGLFYVHQLFFNKSIIPFNQLQEQFNIPDSYSPQYNQLVTSLQSCLQKFPLRPKPDSFTPTATLFHVSNDTTPSASYIYKTLSTSSHLRIKSSAELQWEHDLSLTLTISQWDKVWKKLFKTSKAANITQSLYFIFSRVILTPSVT